ncbi:PREDICTED: uncharacterized protein LOC108771067 [Trachymyrmex cornetzi]|uniref:uncharacterized protein LOC108771067 n=1 Tax=Trachymyrmex cornetzi TaxID=471704 RepID=UPI00084F29B4|nr:PREDICTED: uncharacterized protein LOC108771067 [Trachymyrmex cornetzi]
MDFNIDHYYRLNRIFLSVIGLWPHRYITLRQIQCVVSSFILISVTFPQIKELMQQMQNDWNALNDINELEIFHRYAKTARLFTTTIASK